MILVYPIAYEGDDLPIHLLQHEMSWSESWTLMDWECCDEAYGWLSTTAHGGTLDMLWSPPDPMETELYAVARLSRSSWVPTSRPQSRSWSPPAQEAVRPPLRSRA